MWVRYSNQPGWVNEATGSVVSDPPGWPTIYNYIQQQAAGELWVVWYDPLFARYSGAEVYDHCSGQFVVTFALEDVMYTKQLFSTRASSSSLPVRRLDEVVVLTMTLTAACTRTMLSSLLSEV